MAASVQFTPSPGAEDQALRSPGGMLGLWLIRKGGEVATLAKQRAPKQTGQLASSISAGAPQRMGFDLAVDVEASAPYAMFVHEGTRPHVITPSQASILRFPTRGGGIVYTPSANHPGTRSQPFLMDALRTVMG